MTIKHWLMSTASPGYVNKVHSCKMPLNLHPRHEFLSLFDSICICADLWMPRYQESVRMWLLLVCSMLKFVNIGLNVATMTPCSSTGISIELGEFSWFRNWDSIDWIKIEPSLFLWEEGCYVVHERKEKFLLTQSCHLKAWLTMIWVTFSC